MKLKAQKRTSIFLVILMIMSSTMTYALDGIWHNPLGIDGLYAVEPTERYPNDPVEGENVYVKMKTWPVEMGQSTWLTWKKNGVDQQPIGGDWKYNSGDSTFWEANMGSFSKGDVIEYYIHANKDGAQQKDAGPYSFTVTGWEYLSAVTDYTAYSDRLVFQGLANTGQFQPTLNLSFPSDGVFRVQMSPKGIDPSNGGLSNFTVTEAGGIYHVETAELDIQIEKNPFRMSVYNAKGQLIAEESSALEHRNMAWLTDGKDIIRKVEENFNTPSNEAFFGFGERYNNFNKRGQVVDNYVYNQYKNQNEKTYMSIPFMINSSGYGILNNSTYYSQFRLATDADDRYSFVTNTGDKPDAMLDYTFFANGDVKSVVSAYAGVSGKPVLPPKWAFGLWMSANEWDRQSEVLGAMNKSIEEDIPATVVVLEQWSDESTFYIFNDAEYAPNDGSTALDYDDYTFSGKWNDPKKMVEDLHNAGMKVLLWQVPIEKSMTTAHAQKDNDESYMISQNYAVQNGGGAPYRLPSDKWFGNSLLVDFTNQEASQWWLDKRSYLLDDIKIDGFKTDGGEMVWGRNVTFADGRKGDEMRNTYPNIYYGAYSDFAASKRPESMTFSRSGTTGAQKYPAFWSGDMESTFYAFNQALHAGLTSNLSGVPYWGWDLAGFTGNFPSSELYKRSFSASAFMPIMQFHSEKSNPSVSEERSPWNVASRNNDSSVLDMSKKFVNVRMNLLPYIYSEAKKTSETGVPMMRAMVLEYPNDSKTYNMTDEYFFGENLLVAPVAVEGNNNKSVYLPKGEWIDFFHSALTPGDRTIDYYATTDDLPVFIKAGAILPMNMNSSYELGGTIGNALDQYDHLTFRMYPYGESQYDWFDDLGDGVKTITMDERFENGQVEINMPAVGVSSTVQVYATKPSQVTAGGTALSETASLSAFESAVSAWYYDTKNQLIYVKTPAHNADQSIVLSGVEKMAYEAEYADLQNVSTNTDHTGFTGSAFVDSFETTGDSVSFDVYADQGGTYDVSFKYASAAGEAQRSIYVNDSKIAAVKLPALANWDTWGEVTQSVTLQAGVNKIKIAYDQDDYQAINLDGLKVNSGGTQTLSENLGTLASATQNGNEISLSINKTDGSGFDILDLKVCDTDILKVDYRPNGLAPSMDTPVIDSDKVWDDVSAQIDLDSDPMTIKTSDMLVEISKDPVRLSLKKTSGKTLLYEADNGGVYHNGIRFLQGGNGNLYGVHGYDFLGGSGDLLRNDTTQLIDAGYQGDAGAPLIWSTSGFGVLMDSDGAYPVTDSGSKKLEMYYGNFDKRRYEKKDVEYYLMVGNPEQIMDNVSDISGKAPMLPKWAMGFMNTEWGIDEAEMRDMVSQYRAKDIPIDSYAIDYDWKKWGEDNYGEFSWNTSNFPSVANGTLKSDMNGEGIQMVGIMKPRIVVKDQSGTRTVQAQDAENGGFWYPGGSEYNDYFKGIPVRDLDFYNEACRTWYFDNLKMAVDEGISGYWNDEIGRVQADGYDFMFGPFQGLHMQQANYEGQRAYNDRRVFSTNRNFYLGAQRYAYTTWSGDIGTYFTNSSSDAGMMEQRERMLSTVNLGQTKWGMDIGGFNPNTADPSPELYAKWMQFGAFTPVFRVHGNYDHQRQPWFFGPVAQAVAKHAIKQRYSLMPYIYSNEWNTYKNGVGLVRPLLMEFPGDSQVKNNVTSWMFGEYLLVSPVMEESASSVDIYLPDGVWTDYYRGTTYEGGRTIHYSVNDESWTDIPLFIREGAIIPNQVATDSMSETPDFVSVDVFPAEYATTFDYFNDAGDNYDYENGIYAEQKFEVVKDGTQSLVTVNAQSGSYNNPVSSFIVEIHGQAAQSVEDNGSQLTKYSALKDLHMQNTGYTVGRDIYGPVTYVKLPAGLDEDHELVASGNIEVDEMSIVFEAEEASISADQVSGQPVIADETSGYTGYGYIDNIDDAGDTVTFYVPVQKSGTHKLNVRYANADGQNQKASVFINGSYYTEITFDKTLGWEDKGINLPLTAGNNIIGLKVYKSSDDMSGVLLDNMSTAQKTAAGLYEAEEAQLYEVGVNTDHAGYTGSGFVDSIDAAGDSLTFYVEAEKADAYSMHLRYANGTGVVRNVSVLLNGTKVESMQLGALENWDTWGEYTRVLNLAEGSNSIQFLYDHGDSGHVNIDSMTLDKEILVRSAMMLAPEVTSQAAITVVSPSAIQVTPDIADKKQDDSAVVDIPEPADEDSLSPVAEIQAVLFENPLAYLPQARYMHIRG